MTEGSSFEYKPGEEVDLAEREYESLMPSVTESPESYPVPATLESVQADTELAMNETQEVYDEVFKEPIEAQEANVAALEEQSNQLLETVNALEAELPELAGGADAEKARTLVAELNEMDRRKISLLQRKVYVSSDLEFRKKEAEQFAIERNEIITQLIELLTTILEEAKQQLRRMKTNTESARFQAGFATEEYQQTLVELQRFEMEIDSMRGAEADDVYEAAFDEALKQIADSKVDMQARLEAQNAALDAAEQETAMLEERATAGDTELQYLQGQLLLEDHSDSNTSEAADTDELSDMEGGDVDEEIVSGEEIEDAEFEEVESHSDPTTPTVNNSISVTS